MTRRAAWTASFLTVTAAAVGMELWAAWDHNPDTVPWTDLVADHVPRPLTMWAVGLLAAWLPTHFVWAYRYQTSQGGGIAVKYAKFVVAVIAAALEAAQYAFPLTSTQHAWVTVGLAAAAALGVRQVPNAPPEPSTVRALSRPPAGYNS